MLDKTFKKTDLRPNNVAIPNSHNLYSTITEKLQKRIDLIGEQIRKW
jgi:hypothetical protein